jgi:hypothetical protein
VEKIVGRMGRECRDYAVGIEGKVGEGGLKRWRGEDDDQNPG